MFKKEGPNIFCLQETHFKYDANWSKVKGWKDTCHANNNTMKARTAILKSAQVDFRANHTTMDKDGPKG